MSETYWIICAVLAVLIGIGFAIRITEHFLTESNNVGDYAGKFSDFSEGFTVVGRCSMPNSKVTPEVGGIERVLRERRAEAKNVKRVNGQLFH